MTRQGKVTSTKRVDKQQHEMGRKKEYTVDKNIQNLIQNFNIVKNANPILTTIL